MKIFAALRDDVNEGFVWVKRPGLPSRCVVRIKNPANSKAIYCEALQIDDNFLTEYNNDSHDSRRFKINTPETAIVMSGWFRAGLGDLLKQNDYPLEIVSCNGRWGRLRACMHHPQVVVRVAAWLGVTSVALGLVGVVLGVISLCPKVLPSLAQFGFH